MHPLVSNSHVDRLPDIFGLLRKEVEMRKLAIVAGLMLSLTLVSFCPVLAQEPPPPSQLLVTPTGPLQVVPVSPPGPTGEAEPPTLVPGPLTLMWGYIPCLAICAPVCMYADLSCYNMAIYMASQEETALRSFTGVTNMCMAATVSCLCAPCTCFGDTRFDL